jgi:hypothetical protein
MRVRLIELASPTSPNPTGVRLQGHCRAPVPLPSCFRSLTLLWKNTRKHLLWKNTRNHLTFGFVQTIAFRVQRPVIIKSCYPPVSVPGS